MKGATGRHLFSDLRIVVFSGGDSLRGVSGHVPRYGAGKARRWDSLAQFSLADVFPRHIP